MLFNTNLSREATTLTKWLVSIPSVAHAKGPSLITKAIYDGLREFPYFKEHGEHLYLVPHLESEKSSVVALVKSFEPVSDTLVLLCDTDTNSPYHYGMLKGFSTNCDELLSRLATLDEVTDPKLKKAIEDGDLLFGLGILQSKCATGSMLVALKELSDNHVRLNINVLFICTSETAIQHRGIKKCIPFVQKLITREHLKLRLAINAKPNFPVTHQDDEVHIYTGNYGKVEPSFYIIGNSTSAFRPYAGFSASIIAAELIRELELNASLTQSLHQKPLIPTFDSLRVKEFGKEYSPDGMQISFSMPIVNIDLGDLLEVLKGCAAKAIEHAADLVDQREAVFARINNEQYVPLLQDAEVVSFSDLVERARANFNGNLDKALQGMVQKCRAEGLSLHQASITIIERLNELARLPRPSIVVYFTDNLVPTQGLSASLSSDRELFMILDGLISEFSKVSDVVPCMATHYAPTDSGFMRPLNLQRSLETLALECPVGVEPFGGLEVPTITLGVKGDHLTLLTEHVHKSMCQYLPAFILALTESVAKTPENSLENPHIDDFQRHLEVLGDRAEAIASAAISEARLITASNQDDTFYSGIAKGTLEPESLDDLLKQQKGVQDESHLIGHQSIGQGQGQAQAQAQQQQQRPQQPKAQQQKQQQAQAFKQAPINNANFQAKAGLNPNTPSESELADKLNTIAQESNAKASDDNEGENLEPLLQRTEVKAAVVEEKPRKGLFSFGNIFKKGSSEDDSAAQAKADADKAAAAAAAAQVEIPHDDRYSSDAGSASVMDFFKAAQQAQETKSADSKSDAPSPAAPQESKAAKDAAADAALDQELSVFGELKIKTSSITSMPDLEAAKDEAQEVAEENQKTKSVSKMSSFFKKFELKSGKGKIQEQINKRKDKTKDQDKDESLARFSDLDDEANKSEAPTPLVQPSDIASAATIDEPVNDLASEVAAESALAADLNRVAEDVKEELTAVAADNKATEDAAHAAEQELTEEQRRELALERELDTIVASDVINADDKQTDSVIAAMNQGSDENKATHLEIEQTPKAPELDLNKILSAGSAETSELSALAAQDATKDLSSKGDDAAVEDKVAQLIASSMSDKLENNTFASMEAPFSYQDNAQPLSNVVYSEEMTSDANPARVAAQALVKRHAEEKARREAARKAKMEAARKAKLEAERKAKEEAERKAKAEAERLEAERKAKEEQERLEAERKAKEEQERLEAEQKAKEEAERLEAERKAKEEQERLEAEQKAKEEAERLEAERKAKEEQERLEAERKAKEEAERLEAERKAKEEQERLEAERKAKEEQERLEAERKAKEEQERLEAEQKAKEEAERLEAERKAKEEQERLEAEQKAKEEAERLEAERKAKEEQERLEAEQKAKEEVERLEAERKAKEEQERLEAEQKAKEEAERLEAERKAKEEQERLEAEQKAKEEAERLEAERKAKEEQERLEAEQKAKEEAERLEAERKAKEEQERLEAEQKAKEEAERLAAEAALNAASEAAEQPLPLVDMDTAAPQTMTSALNGEEQTEDNTIDVAQANAEAEAESASEENVDSNEAVETADTSDDEITETEAVENEDDGIAETEAEIIPSPVTEDDEDSLSYTQSSAPKSMFEALSEAQKEEEQPKPKVKKEATNETNKRSVNAIDIESEEIEDSESEKAARALASKSSTEVETMEVVAIDEEEAKHATVVAKSSVSSDESSTASNIPSAKDLAKALDDSILTGKRTLFVSSDPHNTRDPDEVFAEAEAEAKAKAEEEERNIKERARILAKLVQEEREALEKEQAEASKKEQDEQKRLAKEAMAAAKKVQSDAKKSKGKGKGAKAASDDEGYDAATLREISSLKKVDPEEAIAELLYADDLGHEGAEGSEADDTNGKSKRGSKATDKTIKDAVIVEDDSVESSDASDDAAQAQSNERTTVVAKAEVSDEAKLKAELELQKRRAALRRAMFGDDAEGMPATSKPGSYIELSSQGTARKYDPETLVDRLSDPTSSGSLSPESDTKAETKKDQNVEMVETTSPGVRILRTPNAALRRAQREQEAATRPATAIQGSIEALEESAKNSYMNQLKSVQAANGPASAIQGSIEALEESAKHSYMNQLKSVQAANGPASAIQGSIEALEESAKNSYMNQLKSVQAANGPASAIHGSIQSLEESSKNSIMNQHKSVKQSDGPSTAIQGSIEALEETAKNSIMNHHKNMQAGNGPATAIQGSIEALEESAKNSIMNQHKSVKQSDGPATAIQGSIEALEESAKNSYMNQLKSVQAGNGPASAIQGSIEAFEESAKNSIMNHHKFMQARDGPTTAIAGTIRKTDNSALEQAPATAIEGSTRALEESAKHSLMNQHKNIQADSSAPTTIVIRGK